MKTSPFFMAFLYFIMGILFTYIAILSVEETIWNLITLVCSFVATVNFAVAIRLFMLFLKMNKSNKK